ncbi:unnamed protein product [Calypogeia fissa]
MHIREKIVSYLGDCQYRIKRKVRESRTSNGDYAKPVGMPQEAFDAIVIELNAALDTPSSRCTTQMAAANRACVARVRPTTNYWGQGGYKAFLGTYQKKFGWGKTPTSPERIYAKRYGPKFLWKKLDDYATDEEIDWTPPEGLIPNPISEDEEDEGQGE